MDSYNVTYNGNMIGNVTVESEGLYKKITCTCGRLSNEFCRLFLYCCDNILDLGILIPSGDNMYISTKIAAKRIGDGEIRFLVIDQNANNIVNRIPIDETRPFPYLEKIRMLKLCAFKGDNWFEIVA